MEEVKRAFEVGKIYEYSTYYSEWENDYITERCECTKRTKCFVWLRNVRTGDESKRKVQGWDRRAEVCDAPGYGGELYTVRA